MAVQHETELYKPLKQYFEKLGYLVKSEVRHCDLVGIHSGQTEPLIVEIKKTFNLALLLQGLERQKMTREVYLAVERNRAKKGAHNQRWSDLTALCQRLGLGLMTVTFYKTKSPFVEVLCTPSGYETGRRASKLRTSRLINEFHERSGDYNVGGSTGRKLYTAYREKALKVAAAVQAGGQISPRKAKEHSGVSAAAAIMQHNYYGWFQRVARGSYVLTETGTAALAEYETMLRNLERAEAAPGLEEV
ncbi:DUF2161 family putative PD-(D/E)XK-type phosphodiesterase [Paenibacillus physcomitrellae]|uniref:Restriction endonuclease n=1 Tax=Paenibacillus physcomitrellae TaxID=1619311 RepID=A0ABQ1G809_9BACL|nr:DUF2161 family putative PD-(D/E)XK-type phosphodiesterase [Paenibacillus physcomitrellae]GGA38519.1 hypothetical protein GCM10010917_24770 [Paenibacillus physcomitrellae]